MSHRTNYAIREHGTVRFATARHGGASLPDLLTRGVAEVYAFIDGEAAATADALYNETWCEGLLLLDCDEKVVLFDGVSELMFESAQRRLWYPAIADVWAGWHLLHTPDPVRHLGHALDLPDSWGAAKASSDALARIDPAPLLSAFHSMYINDAQTEVQWLDATGGWQHGVFDCKPTTLLQCGPDLLGVLPNATSVAPRDRTPPRGFLRLDRLRQELHVWTDLPVYRLAIETEARWPGWTVKPISEQATRRYSHQPDRFSLTTEEVEHATRFIEARLDLSSTGPFRDALLMHASRARSRKRPA
ncbi:MAG: hypothetical protein AAGJ10_01770 [Bacteroidota bacterium]